MKQIQKEKGQPLISEARQSTFFLVADCWNTKIEEVPYSFIHLYGMNLFFVHISLYSDHWKFSVSKTKSIFNRPISRYYSVDQIHVIAAELQLTKTMSVSLS